MADKDENEVVEETTPKEETDNEETDTSKEAPLQDTQIDYEAIIKAEEARGKPDPLKAKDAFKERSTKREEEPEDDDKPLTRRQLLETLAAERAHTSKTTLDTAALQLARSLSGSDIEAAAVIAKWKNREFPSDVPLQEQIEEMHAAVNRKKAIAVTKELTRALQGKDSVLRNTATTHRDPPEIGEPKLSPADKSALNQSGFVWDGKQRLYKKPIGKDGKKHVYKDMKTGRSWVA